MWIFVWFIMDNSGIHEMSRKDTPDTYSGCDSECLWSMALQQRAGGSD